MRFCRADFCLLITLAASPLGYCQIATTRIPTSFQLQAQTAVSAGRSFSVVNLTATAEWTAGSQHESGTAQLQAKADGSTNVQLNLGKASRTEIQSKAVLSRTCTWTDAAGTSHDILGPNCLVAIPWFSPTLFTQPSAVLPSLLGTTDNGSVSKDNSTFHELSYQLNLTNANAALTNQMVSQSTVTVLYDPQTFLPARLDYSIHPDTDDSQNIPVKVLFSNYKSVSGVMLPFHIERYVNRTLQLTLDISNATIE